MKKNLFLFVFLFIGSLSFANESPLSPRTAEIKIKTSAVCGMCKSTIERNLGLSKGIIRSSLNLEDKVVTVVYNPKKTNPAKIRQIISDSGYDADEKTAHAKTYEGLEDCCKKGKICEMKE